MLGPPMTTPGSQRWAELAGTALIIGAALLVLWPFVVPIGWAAILAFASWPAFRRIEQGLGGRTGWAAAVTTTLVVLVVVVPAVLVSLALAAEAQRVFVDFRAWIARGPADLIATVERLPAVGPELAARLAGVLADPTPLQRWAVARAGTLVGATTSAVGDLGRFVIEVVLVVFTLFFVYRDGGELAPAIDRAALRLGGRRTVALFRPMGQTVRAVMYGTLLTALTQGALVTIGCWVAGLRAPVLLGALTVILALTPIGAPLVYAPSAAWLLLQGRHLAGVLLLLWGVVVVSTVDNLIRSWFLAGAGRVPFLLAFFGVLGGLMAFGSIGLFLGPAAVALLLALWREWSGEDA